MFQNLYLGFSSRIPWILALSGFLCSQCLSSVRDLGLLSLGSAPDFWESSHLRMLLGRQWLSAVPSETPEPGLSLQAVKPFLQTKLISVIILYLWRQLLLLIM